MKNDARLSDDGSHVYDEEEDENAKEWVDWEPD